jgi:four helix bundle protein
MTNSPTTKFDLEDRLIEFAARCISVAEALPKAFAAKHLGGQMTRSGTSPALNYGEAQAAESRADFSHKMKICLKELRETLIAIKIIKKCNMLPSSRLEPLMAENNELIAIFVVSIATTAKNMNEEKKK